jgi:hypothetical protein
LRPISKYFAAWCVYSRLVAFYAGFLHLTDERYSGALLLPAAGIGPKKLYPGLLLR